MDVARSDRYFVNDTRAEHPSVVCEQTGRRPVQCEKCGGKVKIIASIEDPEVIEKILKHLGLDEASQARNRSPPTGLFDHPTQLF